jgi:hypothetical protein
MGMRRREERKMENQKNLREVQSPNCNMSESPRDGLSVYFWREEFAIGANQLIDYLPNLCK